MNGSVKKHIDIPAGDIETVIGQDTTIIGCVEGSGNIRIDGRIDGDVSIAGNVVIGESGIVQGDIKTGNLIVNGMVTGNVDCDGALSIQAKGAIVGDIRVRSLNIVNGGVFKGRRETSHV